MLDDSTDDIDTILARAETCIDIAKRRADGDFVYYLVICCLIINVLCFCCLVTAILDYHVIPSFRSANI